MANLLTTFIGACLYIFGYGLFIFGGIRLLMRKRLPKTSITSLGISCAFISIGLARLFTAQDGGAPLVLGIVFGIMALIVRHWEKSGVDWIEREGA